MKDSRWINQEVAKYASVIFLAAIIVTSLFWKVLPQDLQDINNFTDYIHFYKPVAENILEGKGIRQDNGGVAAYWPPGHSILLAGIFGVSQFLGLPSHVLLSAVILVGMGVNAVLVYLLGNLVWGPKKALFSVFGWIIFPLTLWLTKQPNSEIFFMVFFYGALVIFWMAIKEKLMNPYLFGCVGLLLGASMLVRAIGVGLGIVLSFLLWVLAGDVKNKIKFQMIFMLLLGNLIIVTPWEAWVYAQTGKVIILSQGGAERVKAGLLLPVNKQAYHQGVKLPRDVKELIKQLETKRHRMTSLPNIGTIIIEEFKNQPWVVTKFMVIKLARGWYGTDSQNLEMPIMLLQIPVLALILWSSFLAWNYGGWERKFVIFVWALVLYFWCITTLVISLVRFMVPAMALLFLLLPAAGEKMRSLVRPYASFPKELHDSK